MRLKFGTFVLDSGTREVLRDGRPVTLSPKAFRLLEILARERPNAVSKENLQEQLWPATFVVEGNLSNLVSELRTCLGEDARRPRVIRTVQRFGYAFSAAVSPEADAEPESEGLVYRLVWGRREIALDPGENVIGRDRRAVVWIDHDLVSRRHARISVAGALVKIEDLGSKNGTYVGGRRIRQATPLADRDVVRIGPAELTLRVLRRTGTTLSGEKEGPAR